MGSMTKASPQAASTLWQTPLRPLIDATLDRLLPSAETQPEPLHRAMRYAVFGEGKRLRPQFLLRVAQACGVRKTEQDLVLRAACAVELIHIASLVHDDLPCFDNAAERRGRPTVHVRFGEARALLVGDALMARSFEILSAVPRALAPRALRLVQLLACATGSSSGLVGGQGLEQDGTAGPLSPESATSYHEMKTGALFGMAAEAAAVAAGIADPSAWAGVGWLVGRGYQLAHALTASPHPRYEAEALKVQLRGLSSILHERIQGLTAEPEPLLTFLDELCGPLLQPQPA